MPGAEPTDWTSFFSGSAWAPDPASGEYYLHLFHAKQPDLNWHNPAVRAAVHDMLRWWLDRGVDGFRFDVVNLVSKGLDESGRAVFVNGPRVHEYLHEMAQAVWADRDVPLLTIGETPGAGVDDARRYTDPARGELDMVFQFEHMHVDHGPAGRFDLAPMDWVAFKAVMNRWQQGLATPTWAEALTCAAFGFTGSHGVPVVNPALGPSSHCMGVRAWSRLRSLREARIAAPSIPAAPAASAQRRDSTSSICSMAANG